MEAAPAAKLDSIEFRRARLCAAEVAGIFVLLGLAVFFLAASWRKWPDPIVDFGQQCYSFWRMSEGAIPFKDFPWNYGPFSLFINAALFKCFGPGIMVLVCANLAVYFAILGLAYAAFRAAWGWHGAFAASAVFISVFSFSHFLSVGNYNYATPYAAEAAHGMALILAATFIVVKWCEGPSLKYAALVGLAGGLSAVIKPEFMLALGVVGIAAVWLRRRMNATPKISELAVMAAGVATPTMFCTLLLSTHAPLQTAFVHASTAWWLALVDHVQSGTVQQQAFIGANHPLANLFHEAVWTGAVLMTVGAVYFAGRILNCRWTARKKTLLVAAVSLIAWECRMREGLYFLGRSLPGLMAVLLLLVLWRIHRAVSSRPALERALRMKLILVLLAAAMLARMCLSARFYHLGFFQAALAGMVAAAMLVTELPEWIGSGRGKTPAGAASWCLLIFVCASIAMVSLRIRADQTEPVGQGTDRFYSTTRSIDGTGAVVNWAAEKAATLPENATVFVLPEGAMINYLARRKSLEPGWASGASEEDLIAQMKIKPPDYVFFITRDTLDFGVKRFGAEGNFGNRVVKWVAKNYVVDSGFGGDPLAVNDHPGVLVMRLTSK